MRDVSICRLNLLSDKTLPWHLMGCLRFASGRCLKCANQREWRPPACREGWRVMGFDQIRQRRLSDDIVEQLEGMILEGTLKSGERLPRPSMRWLNNSGCRVVARSDQKLSAKGLLVSPRQVVAIMSRRHWGRQLQ